MLYILFDYVVAILEICKLILPHGRSSLVPPDFAFPMSYGSYMQILIRSAGFATFFAQKPTIGRASVRETLQNKVRIKLLPRPTIFTRYDLDF